MDFSELRGFRPNRRAVAHAMPPSSYSRLPLRSRKQYSPIRFVFAGDAASGIANADDPGTSEAASGPLPAASLGSTSATSRSAGVSALANAGHGPKNEAAVSSTATRRSGKVYIARAHSFFDVFLMHLIERICQRFTLRLTSHAPTITMPSRRMWKRRGHPRHAAILLAAGSSAALIAASPTPRKAPGRQPVPRLVGVTLSSTGSSPTWSAPRQNRGRSG
jgi:hypothetical protein